MALIVTGLEGCDYRTGNRVSADYRKKDILEVFVRCCHVILYSSQASPCW